ncbi:MAG: zinc ribbon domain-containing protein [Candidatus Heimdallarchaeota archaeon]
MTTVVYVQQSSVSPYSRTVALLLCLFLGGFGAHRFYVGKSGSGILLLLLSLCGFGFLWFIIDLIIILAGSFTDSMGRIVSSWDGSPKSTTPIIVTTPSPPPHPPQPPVPPQHFPSPPPPQKQADEMFCNTCGALVKKDVTFCRHCGAALQQ